MKSTGIVRKVDVLGRVVIPMELRRVMDINVKDPIEIFIEDDEIILKKYQPRNACMITGKVSDDNIVLADGKVVLSKDAAKSIIRELESIFMVVTDN